MVRSSSSLPGLINRCTAGLLLLVACARADSIWTVNIDNGPAPPPQDRPPISRDASSNLALLKYQIPGIVGGYVGFVLLIGVYIMVFGRKLRKAAQDEAHGQAQEMVKPSRKMLESSPSQSLRSWKHPWGRSPQPDARSPSVGSKSPDMQAMPAFDMSVIEKDRMQRQGEMERLYAAVLAGDGKSSRSVTIQEQEVDPEPPLSPQFQRNPSVSSKSFSSRHTPQQRQQVGPPTDDFHNPPLSPPYAPSQRSQQDLYYQNEPLSPQYPQDQMRATSNGQRQARTNMRPIYPPEPQSPPYQQGGFKQQFVSPLPTGYLPTANLATSPANTLPVSPRAHHNRQASTGSNKSGKVSVRNLRISSPISQLDGTSDLEPRTPLTPRVYEDPGQPPVPPTPQVFSPRRSRPPTMIEDDGDDSQTLTDDEDDGSDVEKNKLRWEGHANASAEDIVAAYCYDELEETPSLPQPQPQRSTSLISRNQRQQPYQQQRPQQPQQQPARIQFAPSATGDGSLPLRQFATVNRANKTTVTHHQQQRNNALSPTARTPNLASPTPTKTTFLSPGPMKQTFLSPRVDRFAPLRSAGGAPLTAGLATPHSAYIRTPVTPVAPGLMSKKERKAREKDRQRRVPTVEEEVMDERELWGDGYSD